MKLKKMAMQMAMAFVAAKGVQAFDRAGGLQGVRSKLSQRGAQGGGIDGLLGQFGLGGQTGGAPGGKGGANSIAGLLGGLAGASSGAAGAQRMRGLLDTTRETPEDTPEEEQVSGLMVRAMIQAARADGEIDADERGAILEIVGDADPEDMAFLERQLEEPVDAETLARDTPEGHGIEVYTAAVLAIEPDNRAEAEFLDTLARGLGLGQQTVNDIHVTQGKPPLYTL
ncbi:DUF533 domain-containing protein [Palleronia abyssalis]|uniref:Inner membrane protein YebE n=1 Tax=Palleronia abyssalis TaxID=1501240 RepID=A0A2R8BRP8_9RHOB|nr:DUF533 domain-containing protein [Palleronia abyssalis]SPJ22857.1 Inner membrane protein YebE [Palleronia abyssalis]